MVQLAAVHSYSTLWYQAQGERCSLLAYSSENTHTLSCYIHVYFRAVQIYIHKQAHTHKYRLNLCGYFNASEDSNKEEIIYNRCMLIKKMKERQVLVQVQLL